MLTRLATQHNMRVMCSAIKPSSFPAKSHPCKLLSTSRNAPSKTAHLEVERKFNVNPRLNDELQRSYEGKVPVTNPSAMLSFSDRRLASINDEYFDLEGKLATKGIWIRRRSINTQPEEWEAKCKLGGDYQNSEFEEVYGREKVMRLVERIMPVEKLGMTVEFKTERESWTVKDHFLEATMVIDLCTANPVVRVWMSD